MLDKHVSLGQLHEWLSIANLRLETPQCQRTEQTFHSPTATKFQGRSAGSRTFHGPFSDNYARSKRHSSLQYTASLHTAKLTKYPTLIWSKRSQENTAFHSNIVKRSKPSITQPKIFQNQQSHSRTFRELSSTTFIFKDFQGSKLANFKFKYFQGPTTVLRQLYRSTYISWHLQLRTGRFCWCKVLLPACHCWRQPAYLD